MLPRNQLPLPIPRLYLSLRQSQLPPKLTPQDRATAEQVYKSSYGSRCPHEPRHGARSACITALAQEMRDKGFL